MHWVPDHIPPAEAGLFLPMANGVEWMYRYCDLKLGDTVLVQGTGQQGLSAVLTAKEAWAACIIVTGLSHDAHRLTLARRFGADHTIDVEHENFRDKVMDVTGSKGVNVVVNVTGGGNTTVADSIAMTGKQHCTIVLAAAGQEEINVGSLSRSKIVLKRANGHSFFAVEQAIRLIASGKYPLQELYTHSYGLADVGLAIRTVAGDSVTGGIHVSVLPWSEK
jgi:threonine dehydrogenase-like Zn-dependent dehydrogenase